MSKKSNNKNSKITVQKRASVKISAYKKAQVTSELDRPKLPTKGKDKK